MYLRTAKIVKLSEGGETVNNEILMSSGAENIDFMIHGIFKYEIFGHEVWITTSHVCILIVMALMLALAIAGNRAIRHAKEVPEGFQNVIELIVELLDNMVEVCELHQHNLHLYPDEQYIRSVWFKTANGRFRHNICNGSYYILPDPYYAVQESAAKTDLDRYVFPVTAMTADCRTGFAVLTFVRKRAVRNRYDGACIWIAE